MASCGVCGFHDVQEDDSWYETAVDGEGNEIGRDLCRRVHCRVCGAGWVEVLEEDEYGREVWV